MFDVVLIEPPYYKREKKPREQPQLGLAYIASYLEEHSISVCIIDCAIDNFETYEVAEKVKKHNPLIVGLTGTTDDRFGIFEIIKQIKTKCPEVLMVVGGPHFSYLAQETIENIPEIDVVVIGDGEYVMYELFRSYHNTRRSDCFHHIGGIAFRSEANDVVITSGSNIIMNLDIMPMPAWHLFNMEKYQGIMSAGAPYRSIGIISSRGCPYRCAFCANSLSKKTRFRDPKLFVDEIRFLQERYGFEALNIQDDSFTANVKHTKAVCNEILKRNIRLKWYCSLRVDRGDIELLQLMKEAGCIALGFGIEFPSNEVLRTISKGVTVEMMEETLRNVSKVGFPYVRMFFMESLPGQNRKNTIEAQLNKIKLNKILYGETLNTVNSGAWTRIYPGTELYKLAINEAHIFKPSFKWHEYYKSPQAKELNLNILSLPIYENKSFKIKHIRNLNKTFNYYLKLNHLYHKNNFITKLKIYINLFIYVCTFKNIYYLLTTIMIVKKLKNTKDL